MSRSLKNWVLPEWQWLKQDTGVHTFQRNQRLANHCSANVQPMWDFNIYEELFFNDQHYLDELSGLKKKCSRPQRSLYQLESMQQFTEGKCWIYNLGCHYLGISKSQRLFLDHYSEMLYRYPKSGKDNHPHSVNLCTKSFHLPGSLLSNLTSFPFWRVKWFFFPLHQLCQLFPSEQPPRFEDT